jgi:Tol biopolymer transport system component
MKIRLGALGLVTTLALIAVTAFLIGDPAGAAATRSGAARYTGTVAFLRDGKGLQVIRADGTGLKRLTPPGMTVDAYAWSPNGHLIAFIGGEQQALWVVRPDGTELRQLLAAPALTNYDLSWSPNSTEIATTAPTNPQTTGCGGKIYIVPIDGSQPKVVPGPKTACGVAWSRKNEIAYWADGIWVVHPDGSDRRQVSRRGWGWVRWSADGGQIAFGLSVRVRQGLGLYRGIGVVGVDGSHFHVLTRNAYNEYPAAWSPHGRRILYGRANNGGIYVTQANGHNNHRVTPDSPPGSVWPALAWSPNGDSIVYDAPTGTGSDLYVVSIDGRGKVQLTSPPDSDGSPTWVAP